MTVKQITGRKNLRNGMSFEYKCLASEKRDCGNLTVLHADGSRGLFDIICITKRGQTRCITCKANGYLTPTERNALHAFISKAPAYVQVELHKKESNEIGKVVLTI